MATRIVPDTTDRRVGAGSRHRRFAASLAPPFVALLAAWTMIAYRSPYSGWRLFDPSSYSRWDSGHYLHIARSGYTASWHCGASHLPQHLPPGNYLCGTIGWFPGYPAAMRGLSAVTGLPLMTAGLVVAWVCWYLVLVLMWRLLADARSIWTRWMCLLIAAFFPGQVYLAALFPISLCIAGILGCLYVALRTSRPTFAWAGFVAGFVAASSYLTAIVLVPALLITGLVVFRGRRRFQAIVPAIGAAAGFGAVLLTMQIAVGMWNAYFLSMAKYGVGAHLSLDTLIDRLRPLWTPGDSQVENYTASQTLLTLCFVSLVAVATIVPVVRSRALQTSGDARDDPIDRPREARLGGLPAAIESRISAFDLTFLMMAIGVWLVPYIAGGSASTYRSEAFVVVGVPLLRKLPAYLLLVPLVAAVYVAWHMAPYFFNKQLI